MRGWARAALIETAVFALSLYRTVEQQRLFGRNCQTVLPVSLLGSDMEDLMLLRAEQCAS